MTKLSLLIALVLCACEPQGDAAAPTASMPDEAIAISTAQSKAPLIVPMPKSQAEIDRLILAGYSPHGTHLHPPGMKKCPLEQEGNESVM